MKKTRALSTTVLLASVLAVTACSDDPSPTEPTQTGTTATDAPTGTSTSAPDAGPETAQATTTPDVAAHTLVPVSCGDLPREPTEQEEAWLVEPGPYSGEAFDQPTAVAAVQAQSPQTDQEYADAIIPLVQGDYVEHICEMIRFTPDLGDGQAGPTAGSPEIESVGQNHFALVLDSSGSMAADAGGATRMEAAKDALGAFTENLPADATVSLRLYGHEGTNTEEGKAESCESSEVVYEGEPAGLAAALEPVQPVGYTPLAKAIGDSTGDIPEDSTEAIVYVVTDGIESCGGDPVQAAEDVAASGVKPIINVIGFQVGDSDQEALAAIAEAGGGEFSTADSAAELRRYWEEEQDLLRQAWREWMDSERERLVDTSNERFDTIWQEHVALRGVVNDDNINGMRVVAQLRREGDFDMARQQSVGALVDTHFDEVADYSSQFRDNISAVGENLRGDLGALYEQSSTTWQDFYDRKRGAGD